MTFIIYYHSRPEDAECCGVCIYYSVQGLGYLFCIKRMSRYARIGLLWIYVIAAFVTLGLMLRLRVFSATSAPAAPTDMRRVDEHLSHVFCDSVTFRWQGKFSAYTLNTRPVISRDHHSFNFSYDMHVEGNSFGYKRFYLIQGSLIHAESQAFFKIDCFIIKGKTNLNIWKSNKRCTSCFVHHDVITSRDPSNVTLSILESDDYYFVYLNSNQFLSEIMTRFWLTRTFYNVSSASSTCTADVSPFSCDVPLNLWSKQSVVFYSLPDNPKTLSEDMDYKCNPRLSMYLVILMAVPLALFTLVSFLLLRFCKKSRADSDHESLVK